MQNRLFVRVEDFRNGGGVSTLIEMITNPQRLQKAVAVKLLVIIVGHMGEHRLILRQEHRYAVSPEIRAGHGNDMRRRMAQYIPQHLTELITRIRRHMMKLINGHQHIIERSRFQFLKSKAQRRMRTDQNPVVTLQKGLELANLALFTAGGA